MGDQKPPRLTGDERETARALLQYQRESMVRKCTGVSDEAARNTVVGSGTSLLWLITHMVRAESLWVLHRFAGQDVDLPYDSVGAEDTLTDAIATYQSTWRSVDAVIGAAPNLDQPCANVGDGDPVNLRWVLMHLLEETARHAGHADILRELIDGEVGR